MTRGTCGPFVLLFVCLGVMALIAANQATAQNTAAKPATVEATTQGMTFATATTATAPTNVPEAIAYHTQLILDAWQCEPLLIRPGISSTRYMTVDFFFGPRALWTGKGISGFQCSIYAVGTATTLLAHGHYCVRDARMPDQFSFVPGE